MRKLWYKRPARFWQEALPLGNGYMGVMIYGSSKKEKLCFNDGTLWSGYPKNQNNPNSLKYLPIVRNLIFSGQNQKADRLCEEKMSGDYCESFLPLGMMSIAFRNTDKSSFSRSLDLEKGLHSVDTKHFHTEAFASNPSKVFVYSAKSDRPFSAKIKVRSKLHHETKTDDGINLYGVAPDYVAPNYVKNDFHPIRYDKHKGMVFCLRAEFQTDGCLTYTKQGAIIQNATHFEMYVVTKTGFNGYAKMPDSCTQNVIKDCKTQLKNLSKNYDGLKQKHVKDFTTLMQKENVHFSNAMEMPVNLLLRKIKYEDILSQLSELLYHFGKYMIVSSSRNAGQPINLQGIWNKSLRPPWSSNYTTNINVEMNYWGVTRAGLSDCIEPFIKMVYEIMQNGRKTAQTNYGCEGFACNHNVDIWRKTSPVKGTTNYMYSPLCGAWLANEVYAHYKNGALTQYEESVREIVTESAKFLLSYLVLHDGRYVICPSVSPENTFYRAGKKCNMDYGSAYEMGITKELFKNALEISKDVSLKQEIRNRIPLLYEFKEGKDGLLEWHEDYDTVDKGHRHFSPLYAFYPGTEIGYYKNSKESSWAKKLFHTRLANTKQYIGWSAAWAICLAGRFREADTAQKVIYNLISKALFPNLFCVHPLAYFQIDGNLGFIAGIHELLLTEENHQIELLPALPHFMKKQGTVQNMIVNGASVSFSWKDGKVYKVSSDTNINILKKNLADNINYSENIHFI